MRDAGTRFPGYRGSELFRPIEGLQDEWTALYRYDSAADLDAWLTSPQRARLLAEGKAFHDFELRTVDNSFGNWFAFDAGQDTTPPSDTKSAIAVWVGLYPTVVLLSIALFLLKMPLWLEHVGGQPAVQHRDDVPGHAVLRQPDAETLVCIPGRRAAAQACRDPRCGDHRRGDGGLDAGHLPRHHRDLAPVAMRRAPALVVIGAWSWRGCPVQGHRESQGGPAAFREPVRLSSKDGVLEVRLSAHQGSVDLDTVSQPVSNFLVFGYTPIKGSSSDGSTAGDNLYPARPCGSTPGSGSSCTSTTTCRT